jgi:hypothetical protein
MPAGLDDSAGLQDNDQVCIDGTAQAMGNEKVPRCSRMAGF